MRYVLALALVAGLSGCHLLGPTGADQVSALFGAIQGVAKTTDDLATTIAPVPGAVGAIAGTTAATAKITNEIAGSVLANANAIAEREKDLPADEKSSFTEVLITALLGLGTTATAAAVARNKGSDVIKGLRQAATDARMDKMEAKLPV